MRLVEIWRYGDESSAAFVLIDPYYAYEKNGANGWVINGHYDVICNKEKNQIRVLGAPKGDFDAESFYLGDVEYDGNYNSTIWDYEVSKEIAGKNLIKVTKPEEKKKDAWADEPAF